MRSSVEKWRKEIYEVWLIKSNVCEFKKISMSLASSTIQSSNISFDLRTSHYLDQQTVTLVYPAIKMLLDQTD
jgi:hypothetical protein